MLKKPEQPEENVRLRLTNKAELEMFAVVTKLHGTNQIKATFEDGQERMCRIPGKMKKKIWIREGDVIIAKLWDFQPSKANVMWRYFGNQKAMLHRQGLLKGLPVYG